MIRLRRTLSGTALAAAVLVTATSAAAITVGAGRAVQTVRSRGSADRGTAPAPMTAGAPSPIRPTSSADGTRSDHDPDGVASSAQSTAAHAAEPSAEDTRTEDTGRVPSGGDDRESESASPSGDESAHRSVDAAPTSDDARTGGTHHDD